MKDCCKNCTEDLNRIDALGHEFGELLGKEYDAITGAISVLKEKKEASDNDDQEEAQAAREFILGALLRLRWIANNMANMQRNIDDLTNDYLKVEAGYVNNKDEHGI